MGTTTRNAFADTLSMCKWNEPPFFSTSNGQAHAIDFVPENFKLAAKISLWIELNISWNWEKMETKSKENSIKFMFRLILIFIEKIKLTSFSCKFTHFQLKFISFLDLSYPSQRTVGLRRSFLFFHSKNSSQSIDGTNDWITNVWITMASHFNWRSYKQIRFDV